jgi:hypothetical protein
LPDVYYALGGAYFAKQDYEQAIRSYEHAKELSAEGEAAWAEGAQGNFDQAYVKNAMRDVLFDLDFSNVASEGDVTYAIARTGQKVEVEGAVHLVDGPWEGSQALVVEEGTTNFVINPSFEKGTANWTNDAGRPFTTCAISSDQARHGATSLHCSSDGVSDDAHSAGAANADGGQTWTASCWVYLVSGDFRLTIQEKDAGWSDKASAPADTSRRNQWQRVVVTTAFMAEVTDGRIKIGPDGTAGSEFYVDSVQFERGGHATTYTDGAQGDGYSWSGAPHASVSRRMASYLQLTGYTHAPFSGSVVLWVRPRHDNDEALGRNVVFWRWFAPADVRNDILVLKYDSNSKLGFEVWRDGGGVAGAKDTFAYEANEWLHMVLTWNNSGDEMGLYVNGLLHANSTYSSAPNDMSSMLVGAFHDAAKGANAAFAHVATFDRALTGAEVAALYRAGAPAGR